MAGHGLNRIGARGDLHAEGVGMGAQGVGARLLADTARYAAAQDAYDHATRVQGRTPAAALRDVNGAVRAADTRLTVCELRVQGRMPTAVRAADTRLTVCELRVQGRTPAAALRDVNGAVRAPSC